MQPQRWQQIDELFHAAIKVEPSERPAFLAQACAGDETLRTEVESLVSSHGMGDSFFETPAADVAAELLAEAEARLTSGQTIGPYKILSLLGSGGMGEVYLADDIRLKRKIALKVLPPRFTVNPDRVRRFEREARAASALNHPNIVTIYEIGESNSSHFIATEFVDGKTLRQMMHEKPLKLSETINVSLQVAGALSAAHSAGIVHRDIKPENIMIRADGYVKILDFGLAKLTDQQITSSEPETPTLLQSNPGLVMGTVQYMSPEQARGRKVDARTDIWSLGIVLYELLSGHVPFRGETPSHVMVSLMEDELPPLTDFVNVPPELDRIVNRALRKNQKERYQSASELARDLKKLKEELQLEARLKGFLEAVPSSNGRTTKSDGQTGAQASSLANAFATETVALQSHPTSSAEYLVRKIKYHKRGVLLAAAALMTATIVVGYSYVVRNGIPAASEPIDSIAVLPFVNVNNDPNTQYLSEGISDSIINSLSRLRAVKVMPLNSVLRYKDKQIDPEAVGAELKVRAVLIGRLALLGDELNISIELLDVRDKRRLWGEQYHRKLADIFIVQNEIARQISANLRLRLSGDDQKQLVQNYTQNTHAYQLYSLGKYYMRQFPTQESLEKAIEYFAEASKLDPNYSLAYSGLYEAYYQMGWAGFWLPKEAREKMEWAAMKAVELEDTSMEAHLQLARIRKINWDWAGAEKENKRALELFPNERRPYFSYAGFLVSVGRPDEAMAYAERGEELDRDQRDSPIVARVYLYKGQYDKAIEWFLKKRGDRFELCLAYLANGMNQEALKALDEDVPANRAPVAWLGSPIRAYVYARTGRRAEALQILRQQQQAAKQQYISPFNFAVIYTGLGEKDRALEYLTKACEEHVVVICDFMYGPLFESLHSDPRYQVLLQRMNLPA
jgi:eukaryotic-like serine/threonine-protein kinase